VIIAQRRILSGAEYTETLLASLRIPDGAWASGLGMGHKRRPGLPRGRVMVCESGNDGAEMGERRNIRSPIAPAHDKTGLHGWSSKVLPNPQVNLIYLLIPVRLLLLKHCE
jgi:hypothetical protein